MDDWDVEFGFADDAAFTDDDSNVDEADKLISSRIIGITADRLDPLLKETDWGDDFELGDANNSLFASKVKKSASIPEGLHNVWRMEDTTTSTHRHLSLPRALFRVHVCTLTLANESLSLSLSIQVLEQMANEEEDVRVLLLLPSHFNASCFLHRTAYSLTRREPRCSSRAQTKDADATSASGEGEDWDKEFGIETEEDSTSLFANLRATAVRASIDLSIDLTLSHSSHDT